MPERFTTEAGRNAPGAAGARRRGPCRRESRTAGAAPASPGAGAGAGNGECLMISRLSTDSISSSVPKPKTFGLPSADAEIQRRWSRENGRSSLLEVTMYWRSSGSERLEQVAQVPDDREVAQDRALALQQVVADEAGRGGRRGAGADAHRMPMPRHGREAYSPQRVLHGYVHSWAASPRAAEYPSSMDPCEAQPAAAKVRSPAERTPLRGVRTHGERNDRQPDTRASSRAAVSRARRRPARGAPGAAARDRRRRPSRSEWVAAAVLVALIGARRLDPRRALDRPLGLLQGHSRLPPELDRDRLHARDRDRARGRPRAQRRLVLRRQPECHARPVRRPGRRACAFCTAIPRSSAWRWSASFTREKSPASRPA